MPESPEIAMCARKKCYDFGFIFWHVKCGFGVSVFKPKNYWSLFSSRRDQRDLYRSIDPCRLVLETVAVSVLYYPKLAISVIFTHLTKVLFFLTKNTHA